jgi:glycine C-acetyltransferase
MNSVSSRSVLLSRHERVVRQLRDAGQYKQPHLVGGAIGPVAVVDGRERVVLCSNDYLALANHAEVVASGIAGLTSHGAGTASVRFICGTLDLHRVLEAQLAELVGLPSALTYVSCWNANGALFPTVTAPGDVIVSDALNHASIIDSVRQAAGVRREVYRHADLDHLERLLGESSGDGVRWVVTDGVFSMEGDLAPLPGIADLCEAYGAMLVVDDSHGIGVLGATGRGTAEHFGMTDRVDVVTGTLGKALGGAAGGFVAASPEVDELLEQRARPGLFSNALPATVAASAGTAIRVMVREPERVARLRANAATLRTGLRTLGYDCEDTPTAIIPIVLGDARKVQRAAERLFDLGVLVVGFSYPVVPEGAARLRVQASAGHTDEHLARALDAFATL